MEQDKNKTSLRPVSRPVEQILGLFSKGFKKGSLSKSLKMVQKVKYNAYLGLSAYTTTF